MNIYNTICDEIERADQEARAGELMFLVSYPDLPNILKVLGPARVRTGMIDMGSGFKCNTYALTISHKLPLLLPNMYVPKGEVWVVNRIRQVEVE